ncbi:MAG TPA: hypothetical protein VD864_09465, partial [Nocardioides sp.]|nr:hypothetical protein [Nocardioides sp.]
MDTDLLPESVAGAETWDVSRVGAGDRDEAWRSIVSDTHLPWTLDRARETELPVEGRIMRRRLGDI